MYSSIPLLLFGNNSLVDKLRCSTSIVLYLHSEFYGKHCCFESAELSLTKTALVTKMRGIISDFLS